MQAANAATPTCDEVLAACDDAVQRAELVISKQGELMRAYDSQASQLTKSLERAQADLAHEQAWYKQPSFVFPAAFVAGIVTTLLAVKQVNK